MRVLIISPLKMDTIENGSQMLIISLARFLIKLGYKVTILTYGYNNYYYEDEKLKIIQIRSNLPLTYRKRPWLIPFLISGLFNHTRSFNIFLSKNLYEDKEFRELLKKLDFDVLNLEVVGSYPCYREIFYNTGSSKIIIRMHDIFSLYIKDENSDNTFTNFVVKYTFNYERKYLNFANKIVVFNKHDDLFLRNFVLLKGKEIFTIFPFVDLKFYESIRADSEEEIILIPSHHRDMERAINAAILLARKLKEYRIVLTIPNNSINIKSKDNLEIKRSLTYTEYIGLLKKSKVLVIPRVASTGTSSRIIEGLACMKPIITTRSTARSFEGLGIKGLIIENDINNYPKIIENLIKNQDYYLSICEELKENMKFFNSEYILKVLRNIYRI